MGLKDYTFSYEIGEGNFSRVVSAIHNKTQTMVAIKIIPKENLQNSSQYEETYKEIEIIKNLRHPFICQYFDSFETDKEIYIVLEYSKGGTLLNLVNNVGGFTEKDAVLLFAQIISAVTYLHEECNIAHRDLKAENILLDRYGALRIIDFGLSKEVNNNHTLMKTQCGSPSYVAPEMISGSEYTNEADIWSLGIILYAIVACKLPYEATNLKKLFNQILYENPHYPNFFSSELISLLKLMLKKDPEERITLKEIPDTPWIRSKAHIIKIRQKNVTVADDIIFDKLKNIGYDLSELQESLSNNMRTPSTVAYNIVRRELETDKLNCLLRAMINVPANKYLTKDSVPRKSCSALTTYSKVKARTKPKRRRSTLICVPHVENSHPKPSLLTLK